ncbi:MAG: TatD family hydrolase [Planctomycetes bacterium]|nr:TatD family hydrolase [Planctomycetota bacterium]MCB9828949.1 TatD family hydrolase [Planctomycetota bacterium]MCB9901805.1 TatD family hydrolase [Planctomycetota bacterium]
MRIFEPHAHMFSRVTDDYERMALCGVRAVLEPAFWLGQNRTSVGTFVDYFDTLLGWERFRAQQFGIHHFCTMALNPREANDDRVNADVLAVLPRYLEKDSVLGVGEIGLDDQTPKEEKFFAEQVQLAIRHDLPVLVHTPHRDKKKGFERCIDILKESGIPMERVLLDHGNEITIKLTRDLGCYSGFSIYPNTKMDPLRMSKIVVEYGVDRMIINSACDWGVSDPLMIPRTIVKLQQARVPDADIEQLVWKNPIAFFAQSGRLQENDLAWPASADLRETFEGNSVLRGQDPAALQP